MASERGGWIILQTGLPNPGEALAKAHIADLAAGDVVNWDIALSATEPGQYADIRLQGLWALESGVVTLERCREVLAMPRRPERAQQRIGIGITVCVSTFVTDASGSRPAVAMARLVTVAPGLAKFEARVAPFVSMYTPLPQPTPTLMPSRRVVATPAA